jgi:hypothetical protein
MTYNVNNPRSTRVCTLVETSNSGFCPVRVMGVLIFLLTKGFPVPSIMTDHSSGEIHKRVIITDSFEYEVGIGVKSPVGDL